MTFESTIKELSEFAIKRRLSFTISPITLDDVFVSLVGNSVETVSHDAPVDYKSGN